MHLNAKINVGENSHNIIKVFYSNHVLSCFVHFSILKMSYAVS